MSQLNSVIRLVTLCLGTALFAFCLGIIGTAASLQGQEWMLYSPGYFKRWIIWLIVCASCHLPISIFGCFSTLKHSQNEEEDRTPSRIKLILSQTLLFLPLVAFAAVGADLRATARSLRAGAALAYGAADGAYEPALVYDRFESAFRAELHARYFAATCGDDEDGFSWSFLNNDVKCEDTMVGSVACQQTCGNCSSETFDNRGEAGCCPAAGPCAAGDARGCPFDRCRAALGDYLGGAVGPLGALALASTGLGLAHLLGLGALACYYPADDLERQLVKAGTIKKPPAQAKKKGGSKAASAAGTTGGSPSTAAASASPPGGNPQGRLGAEAAAAAAEDRQGGGVCRDMARPPALQLSRQNSSWRSARDLSRSARDLSSAGRRVPSSRRRVLGTDEEEERFVLNEDGTGVVRISTGRRLAPQEVNPHMENIERINEVLGNFTARVEQRLATSLVDGIRHLRVHRPFTPAHHHHPHAQPPPGGEPKSARSLAATVGSFWQKSPRTRQNGKGAFFNGADKSPTPPEEGGRSPMRSRSLRSNSLRRMFSSSRREEGMDDGNGSDAKAEGVVAGSPPRPPGARSSPQRTTNSLRRMASWLNSSSRREGSRRSGDEEGSGILPSPPPPGARSPQRSSSFRRKGGLDHSSMNHSLGTAAHGERKGEELDSAVAGVPRRRKTGGGKSSGSFFGEDEGCKEMLGGGGIQKNVFLSTNDAGKKETKLEA